MQNESNRVIGQDYVFLYMSGSKIALKVMQAGLIL